MSSAIRSFRLVPIQLFRVSAGKKIKLREYEAAKGPDQKFDVVSENGVIKPKALDPSKYTAPNGASMRSLGKRQIQLVSEFKGTNVVVYAIEEGTELPDDLILVREKNAHYSLQPAVEMSLTDLNQKISDFLKERATSYTKKEWLAKFAKP